MKFRLCLLVLSLAFSACGGSGGSSSDSTSDNLPKIAVVAPAEGAVVSAGSTIEYQLSVQNFELMQPMPSGVHSPKHNGVVHEEGDAGHDGEGSHGDDEATDGIPREGHLHIYLDEQQNHLTAWSASGQVAIPSTTTTGMHSLRFELRDNSHGLVGTPESEAILFFEVK
jgi:hypothetical protein